MTAVTWIFLYTDSDVIYVTAVISYQLYEPTFADVLGAVFDAHGLQYLAGELSQCLATNHIGRGFGLLHFGQQLRGRAHPLGVALHKVHHPKKEFRQLRLVNVLAVLAPLMTLTPCGISCPQ